jgi:hypothetical protein
LTNLGKYIYVFLFLSTFLMISVCCTKNDYVFPPQSSWMEHGPILEPGPPGSWDVRLHGAISPATVIRKDGTYFLYYIGADGNRSTDGGPRHRALGVATSSDGFHFVKYDKNPILTFLPHGNEEEGIFSAGASLDSQGNIFLYYSACDAGNAASEFVNCDGRLAVSSNGLDFIDLGKVLDHADHELWGFGDEIFPVGCFRNGKKWYVYYIAKGRKAMWDLGLAWGKGPMSFEHSDQVLASGDYVVGGGDPVPLDGDILALFLRRSFKEKRIEVRVFLETKPAKLGRSALVYRIPDVEHLTVLKDEETHTWFLYYLGRESEENYIGVKTAGFSP